MPSRHQSRRVKTRPPARRAFRSLRPARPVVVPAAPASDNARQDRADQTAHTAPGTIAAPFGSATDRSFRAVSKVDADRADRRRRTPPTRRPPASLPADGEALQAPGSESYSPRVRGPKAANRF